MRFLLDTHIWIWFVNEERPLPKRVRDIVTDPGSVLLWSSACVWEMTVKYALGKLTLPEPPASYVPSRMLELGAAALPITHDHALRLAELPAHHRDPFDRLLVAQAQVEGLTLVTGDPKLSAYDVDILWD